MLEIGTEMEDEEEEDVVDKGLELLDELEETAPPCAGNSSILLFKPSLTHRLPEASNATPSSPYRVDCVALVGPPTEELAVMLGSPITSEAFSLIEKGWVNSRTLPKVSSETQRFPDLSNVRPSPKPMHPALAVTQKRPGSELRLETPKAKLALSPVERGVGNLRILPPCGSATQRFPVESNATAVELSRLDGEVNAEQL